MDGRRETLPSTISRPGSLRGRSNSELAEAIRSPDGEAAAEARSYIVRRARTVRKLGYTPDETPDEERAAVEEFVVALERFPMWAIEHAFDEWVRTMPKRPAPGNIAILAGRAIEPISNELAYRRKVEEDRREEEDRRRRGIPSKEEAEAICAANGFTPRRFGAVSRRPMARSDEELFDAGCESGKARHWSEDLPPGHPTRKLFGTDVEDT